jgi:hypothetical protein
VGLGDEGVFISMACLVSKPFSNAPGRCGDARARGLILGRIAEEAIRFERPGDFPERQENGISKDFHESLQSPRLARIPNPFLESLQNKASKSQNLRRLVKPYPSVCP